MLALPPLPDRRRARERRVRRRSARSAHPIVVEDPDRQRRPIRSRSRTRRRARSARSGPRSKRALIVRARSALVLGAVLGAGSCARWLRRPRPVPPPPPPRPPWEVALEELDEVRHAGLLATQTLRRVLRSRERRRARSTSARATASTGSSATTDEMLAALAARPRRRRRRCSERSPSSSQRLRSREVRAADAPAETTATRALVDGRADRAQDDAPAVARVARPQRTPPASRARRDDALVDAVAAARHRARARRDAACVVAGRARSAPGGSRAATRGSAATWAQWPVAGRSLGARARVGRSGRRMTLGAGRARPAAAHRRRSRRSSSGPRGSRTYLRDLPGVLARRRAGVRGPRARRGRRTSCATRQTTSRASTSSSCSISPARCAPSWTRPRDLPGSASHARQAPDAPRHGQGRHRRLHRAPQDRPHRRRRLRRKRRSCSRRRRSTTSCSRSSSPR